MCFQPFVRQTNGPEVRKSRCFISLACPTCHLRFWMSTFVMSQRALTAPQGRYYHPSGGSIESKQLQKPRCVQWDLQANRCNLNAAFWSWMRFLGSLCSAAT